MIKANKFCAYPGCSNLTQGKYCTEHADEEKKQRAEQDKRRGSSRERGYSYRWDKYSKWFLSQPGNQFCKLHLDDGCNIIAECVDHIVPHNGSDDPMFWKKENMQASCIHCNSVKGNRTIVGTYEFGKEGGGH